MENGRGTEEVIKREEASSNILYLTLHVEPFPNSLMKPSLFRVSLIALASSTTHAFVTGWKSKFLSKTQQGRYDERIISHASTRERRETNRKCSGMMNGLFSSNNDGDPEYPGTAIERMKNVRTRVATLSKEDLSGEWEVVRRKLLWAGGLRDLPDAIPGQVSSNWCIEI